MGGIPEVLDSPYRSGKELMTDDVWW